MGWLRHSLLMCSVALMLAGCSLLEVKLESGIEPLPAEQLSMRLFTREYANTFYAGVEHSADVVLASDDVSLKSQALLWKINAEQVLTQTIFQVSPVAAMVDTWAFTAQMAAYFESGYGRNLFGDHSELVAQTSQDLLADYERRMRGLLSESEFSANQTFMVQYANEHPLFDLSFARVSAFSGWLAYRNISEQEAIKTFGSVPEVMTDMSERMAMLASQTPKLLGWKAELFALNSNINSSEVNQTLKQISDTSAKFQTLMAQSPQMMSQLAVDMRQELTPLLEQLDASAERNMAQLSVERQALELLVERERLALAQLVERERQALVKDADALVARTVDQAFEQLTQVLQGLILYIVLFLLVVFFAPLGLGVWLGKRMQTKNNRD
ncbi:chemotaxis protein [Ferrimonas aestuarii]|uniref:Chemotaxis protein n=1 Tax=Ferrimonas aestuarii TaxID=2569539 RepID=A0A4U1BRU4_9GAMM|nr:chemotaxis protein [Ferrimonas aestuarii]TKB58343.1 chemotaxis protein [Ferrimonas aestuarii]